MNVYEVMLTIIGVPAVIAAVVSALHAGQQARNAEAQAKHAESQAKAAEAQAKAAETQAHYSGVQADHAGAQALHAGAQAEVAQRAYELADMAHRDQSQPYVWVDIRGHDDDPSLAVLLIHNAGPTVAKAVAIRFAPAIVLDPQMKRLDLGLVEVSALAPGARLVRPLGFGAVVLATNGETVQVSINGTGPHGELPDLTYDLDLAALGPTLAARTSAQKAAHAIVDVVDQVRRIADNTAQSPNGSNHD